VGGGIRKCTRNQGNRRITVCPELRAWKEQASQNLTSLTGTALHAQRRTEAESVFARLRHNWSFRRFTLRGLGKVTTEWGLLCVAHNLAKMASLNT